MNVKLFGKSGSLSLVASFLFFVAGTSCSKDTKGPSNDAAKSANSTSPDSAGKNAADGTAALPDVTAKIDGVQRQIRDVDDNLTKAIGAEADARKAADDVLGKKIQDLDDRVTALGAKLDTEVARLDAQDKQLAQEVKDQGVAFKADSDKLKVDFEAKVQTLATEVGKQFGDSKVAEQEARTKLRADIEAQIGKVADGLAAFKKLADDTYATKAELNAANLVIQNLKNSVEILGRKIDDNDAKINDRVSKEIKDAKNELTLSIDGVRADVDSIKNQLQSAIALFNSKVKELSDQASKEASDIRSMLANMQVNNEQSLKGLNDRLDGLTNRVATVEVYSQDIRKELLSKVAELQSKDAELSDDVRKARDEAAKQLSAAIAQEQASRAQLQSKLDDLAKEVQRVSDVANQALNLSKANDLATRGLRADLEAAKKDWQKQLDDLRTDMNDKINAIADAARNIVVDLGKEVQRQFVESTTGIADLRTRDNGLAAEVARLIADKVPQVTLDSFKTNSKPVQDKLTDQTGSLRIAVGAVETEFMYAFDYVHGKLGVDTTALNNSFKPVAALAVCKGITGDEVGEQPRNSSVAEREWFFHLARVYSTNLVAGLRTGNAELDKIYHGTAPWVDGKSLFSAIILASVPSRASGTSGACVTKVEDWAKGILSADTDVSKALRDVLAKSLTLRSAITTMLKPAIEGLREPSDKLQQLVSDAVKPKLGSDALVKSYLESSPAPGMNAQFATVFIDRAGVQQMLAAHLMNSDNILKLAKDVAEAKDKAASTAGAQPIASILASLQDQINQLNKRIDEAVQGPIDKINKLDSGLKTAFNLIAGIASRLGYADIVEMARSEITKLGGDLDKRLLFPVGCKATSHFFNYAEEAQPLKRCDSGVDAGDGIVVDNGRCRTVRHENTTTNTSIANYRTDVYSTNYGYVNWVNTRNWLVGWQTWSNLGTSLVGQTYQQFVTNYSNTDVKMQWGMVGALRAPIISPLLEEAQKLLLRKEGDPFPSDRKTMIGLRIFGNAWKWRITDMNKQSIDLDATAFRVNDNAAGLIYEIPAAMFLATSDGQAGFTESARVIALDSTGKPAGKDCMHSMNGGTVKTQVNNIVSNVTYVNNVYNQTYTYQGTSYYTSPIVLDLSGKGMVETVSPEQSRARFDLKGNGSRPKVGWIKPNAGFLVLDVNSDGKIDSGREMFGTATLLADGRTADNGYQALAQYDKGNKGFIDASDPIYGKLRVWINVAGDGVSKAGELKTLKQLGISKIGTKWSDVPLAQQSQYADQSANNVLLYQSQYWGKNCPVDGCKSYDVYFGVDRSVGVAALK